MSGGQFEVFAAQVLRGMGYRTTVLGGSGDQGVDIVAVGSNGKVAVQCKNYKRAVGNKPVQEVYAGARHHNCDSAWVIAPKGYTKGAHELAASVGVLLFDADSIRRWIKTIDDAEKQASKQAQSA
jgi:restriction system protein